MTATGSSPAARWCSAASRIEHDRGLDGHSDADVLTHAIIDAMLGACRARRHRRALPRHRSPLRGRRLDRAAARAPVSWLAQAGFTVSHVDATVMLERAQAGAGPRADASQLAAALGLELAQVSVKATRGEGMGFVGHREGAAALAVATVQSD